MSLIIGLVGEKGSGKGTFMEQLKRLAPRMIIRRIASSEILSETLAIWDIERNRAVESSCVVAQRITW